MSMTTSKHTDFKTSQKKELPNICHENKAPTVINVTLYYLLIILLLLEYMYIHLKAMSMCCDHSTVYV